MPWRIGKSSKCGSGKPWGVFKKGSSSPEYCHTSEESALRQVRALYANEDKEKSLSDGELDELMSDVKEGVNDKGYYYGGYVGGVTSFRDLDAARESQERLYETYQLNDDFSMLSNNILYNDEIADKGAALTALADEYATRIRSSVSGAADKEAHIDVYVDGKRVEKNDGLWSHVVAVFKGKQDTKEVEGEQLLLGDFAYTPDRSNPDSWRIVISRRGETDLVQLSKALTELSCHAKEYGMSEADQRAATDKIFTHLDFITAEGGDDHGNRLSVWKEAGGQYRWLAVYSNNLEDQDNPPETIMEQSHKAFTYLVKEGEVPYPELWHWHIPGTRWGVADFLDYRDGYALAGGTVDPGCEKEAEALLGRTDIKVSHGMPRATIVRDPDDTSKIIFHLTKEISDLPHYAAANQATTFSVDLIKEANMPSIADVIKEKSDYLKGLGYSDAQIEEVKTRMGGLLKKEAGDDLQVKQEGGAADQAAAGGAEGAAEGEAAAAPVSPTLVELQQELAAIKQIRAGLEQQQLEVTDAVKEIREVMLDLRVLRDVQVSEVKEGTPRESSDFISTLLKKGSPIGAAETRVDGRSALAKGPKEKESDVPQVTGIPILDQAFQGMTQANQRQ